MLKANVQHCAAFNKQGAEENNFPKVGGLENETK